MTDQNPLLAETPLPKFASIDAAHVLPAVKSVLAEYRRRIDALPRKTMLDNPSIVMGAECPASCIGEPA